MADMPARTDCLSHALAATLRYLIACPVLLVLLTRPAVADVVDTITLLDVESVSEPGDPFNEIHVLTSNAEEAYILGSIDWDGVADPTEHPGFAGSFPSFSEELLIDLRHVRSGVRGFLQLGSGTNFEIGTQFVGSYLNFNGLLVQPGDEFQLEFAEAIDDDSVDPDAVWQSIRLDFNDEYVPPVHPDPPLGGIVRFDATGRLTFPTNIPLGEAGQFWGVQYGAGENGPSITAVEIDGQEPDSFWFETDFEDGLFQTSVLQGVNEPNLVLLGEDEDEPGNFRGLRLEFDAGEFEPGDTLRFGASVATIDIPSNFFFASGSDLGQLAASGPLLVTVEFEDGGVIRSELSSLTPGVPNSSFIDFAVSNRDLPTAATDFNQDGRVDGDDLLELLLGFGTPEGASLDQGDADADGDVDRDDFALWRQDFASSAETVAVTATVPEPSALLVLLAAASCCGLLLRQSSATSSLQSSSSYSSSSS